MLRLAFAIYMVLVTAAGPNLCCCSLTHLFAGLADRHAASDDLPPCCRHDSGGEGRGERDGCCPRHKPDERRDDKGCPCRHGEAKPAVLDRAVEMPDLSAAGPPLPFFDLFVAFGSFSRLIGGVALPADPPPSLTADELLRVHHQLRC